MFKQHLHLSIENAGVPSLETSGCALQIYDFIHYLTYKSTTY